MSLMQITSKTLTQDLNVEVPEIYVVVAKHQVLGMDNESICEVLNCTKAELQEVEDDSVFKQVRMIVGAAQAQARVNQTLGWDSIEETAIQKLAERLPYEKDSEFLLRVAATANKAMRRQGTNHNVLDPTRQNGRTAITLTERLIQKMTNGGGEVVQERQLSIRDGSMKNPSFDEIDGFLSVSRPVSISTRSAGPTLDDLDRDMQEKGF